MSIKLKSFFSKVKAKIFLSYVLLLAITLLLFGIFSAWWARSILRDRLSETSLQVSQQIRGTVDGYFEDMNALTLSISEMPWVRNIAYMQELDSSRVGPLELYQYRTELRTLTSPYRYLYDTAIVFGSKDLVISSLYANGLTQHFNYSLRPMETPVSRWKEIMGTFHQGAYLYETQKSLGVTDQREPLLCYVKTLPYLGCEYINVLMTVRISALTQVLGELSLASGSSIYIYDGERLVAKGALEGLEDPPSLEVAQKERSTAHDKDGNEYFTFSFPSGTLPWTYVVAIPSSRIMDRVHSYTLISSVFLATALCIGLFISLWMRRKLYRPLKELLDKHRLSTPGTKSAENEYQLINSAFDTYAFQTSSLQKDLEFYLPLVQRQLLILLLYGIAAPDKRALAETLFKGTRQKHWTVAVLYSALGQIDEKRCEDLMRRQPQLPAHCVSLDSKRTALIVGSEHAGTLLKIAGGLLDTTEATLLSGVCIGIGNSCDALSSLHQSFMQACIALNYAYTTGNQAVQLFSGIEDRQSQVVLPATTSNELLFALRAGDFDRAVACVEGFIDQSFGQKVPSYVSMQCLSYGLLSTVLTAVHEAGLDLDEHLGDQQFMQLTTVNEMRIFILDLCLKVCNSVRSRRTGKYSIMKESILGYIDSHFMDGSLSLNALADQFNVSQSHLSRFLQEQLSMHFTDYVNQRRIDEAKKRMHGAQSLEAVCREVGFNSITTFQRAFKKHTGMTPAEYRSRTQPAPALSNAVQQEERACL